LSAAGGVERPGPSGRKSGRRAGGKNLTLSLSLSLISLMHPPVFALTHSTSLHPPYPLTPSPVGDVHGDLGKCIAALEIAGVLAEDERRSPVWTGGDAVVVQLGDVLDRGDNEIGVIMLLRDLDRQARAAGGAVYMLNGNHESLNVCGDFRYVTPGGFREAAAAAGLRGERAASLDAQLRARLALYSPGGPIARELAANPTVLVIGATVFAHGGLLPAHVTYGLPRLNADVAAWMRGDRLPDGAHAPPPFLAMGDASSVMWNRSVGKERFGSAYERHHACAGAGAALDALGAARLVVGHTPQLGGANCECGGRVWRLDVGMSRGVLNAMPAVLEVVPGRDPGGADDAVRVLTPAEPAGCAIGPPSAAVELARNGGNGGGGGGGGGRAGGEKGFRF
jgi:hypothetical protein